MRMRPEETRSCTVSGGICRSCSVRAARSCKAGINAAVRRRSSSLVTDGSRTDDDTLLLLVATRLWWVTTCIVTAAVPSPHGRGFYHRVRGFPRACGDPHPCPLPEGEGALLTGSRQSDFPGQTHRT